MSAGSSFIDHYIRTTGNTPPHLEGSIPKQKRTRTRSNISFSPPSDAETQAILKLKKIGPTIQELIPNKGPQKKAVAWVKVKIITRDSFIALPITKKNDQEYRVCDDELEIGIIRIVKETDHFFIKWVENLQPNDYRYVGTAMMQFAFSLTMQEGAPKNLEGAASSDTINFFLTCGASDGNMTCTGVDFYFSRNARVTKKDTEDYLHWVSWIKEPAAPGLDA